MTQKLPGLHLMADLYECACAPDLMVHGPSLRETCIRFVRQAGLTAVGDYFHGFAGGGVTGAIVLSESHLSVHTWPEARYVAVDIFTCGGLDPRGGFRRRAADGTAHVAGRPRTRRLPQPPL